MALTHSLTHSPLVEKRHKVITESLIVKPILQATISKIIRILGRINIIGFRASIAAVNIAITKQKIGFLLMLSTLWQHVPKPAHL